MCASDFYMLTSEQRTSANECVCVCGGCLNVCNSAIGETNKEPFPKLSSMCVESKFDS